MGGWCAAAGEQLHRPGQGHGAEMSFSTLFWVVGKKIECHRTMKVYANEFLQLNTFCFSWLLSFLLATSMRRRREEGYKKPVASNKSTGDHKKLW